MKVYNLIKELIDLVGRFRAEQKEADMDLRSFSNWLSKTLDKKYQQTKEVYSITGHSIDAEIAAHLGRLSRYSNYYIKNVLSDLPFITDMDFAFTAILHKSQPIGKTDLIRKMAYDKSPGMEIIKRLLKNGIIEQLPNPLDKRGKLLQLTEKGQINVMKAYKKAGIAARTVGGNLTAEEKSELLGILKKLDDFHTPLYMSDERDPEKIINKFSL